MTLLMRGTEIVGRPVVTLAGEDIAQVKDVVYDERGTVVGFTLAGRGFFAGPSKQALPWQRLYALGPDALMVTGEDALVPREQVLERAGENRGGGSGGAVLGSRVLTDTGTDLGAVTDVVLSVDRTADVTGYEVDPTDALGRGRHRVLIPMPDTVAVSGEALVVPAAATEFVVDDLSGFGAAMEGFRERLQRRG